MRHICKILTLVAVVGCSRTVNTFLTCQQVSVPCTCSDGLHGLESCSNGKTTGQCVCVQPVTPTITIAGNPAALSSGLPYTASVNAVDGLKYAWSLTGGTLTTPTNGTSIGFSAGPPGVALLTVDVTNSGADTAPPQQLGVSVVAAPALQASDVLVPAVLTEQRAGIPVSIAHPDSALVYLWTTDNGGAVEPQGAIAHLTTGAVGTQTVTVVAQNSVGAQSLPVTKTVSIKARQIELVAGQEGGPGSFDGSGPAARFGGRMALTADSSGNVYINDARNDLVRRIDSLGNVTTLAGAYNIEDVAYGSGTAAHFSEPVIAYANNALVVAQLDSSGPSTVCAIATLSGLQTSAATLSAVGTCSPDSLSLQALTIDGSGKAYVLDSDGTINAFTAGASGASTQVAVVPALSSPTALAVVSGGTKMYAIDDDGSSVTYSIKVLSKAGASFTDVAFDSPCADETNVLTTDAGGNVYVACGGSIYVADPLPTKTSDFAVLAGASDDEGVYPPVDGTTGASFAGPSGMVVSNGLLYVADSFLIRTVVLSGSDRGKIMTIAGGLPHAGHLDDPDPTVAQFSFVGSISVDANETLHVLETPAGLGEDGSLSGVSDAVCDIRTVAPAGVATQVGGPCSAEKNGSWKLSTFALPLQMASAADGSLFLTNNCASCQSGKYVQDVVQVKPDGLVIRAAGLTDLTTPPAEQADGFATSAVFKYPEAIATSADGLVVIGDSGPTSGPIGTVRLLTDQQIVTVAGDDTCTFFSLEDGCFGAPTALAVDANDTIYAAATTLTDSSSSISQSPVIFSLTPPNFIPKLVAGSHDNCLPLAAEPCELACIRRVTALAVQPQSNTVFFADGELIRNITYSSDGACSVNIVAGRTGQAGVSDTVISAAALNFVEGLAFSPTTLDLYATDNAENVVVRVRY